MLTRRYLTKYYQISKLFKISKRSISLGYDNTNVENEQEDMTRRIHKKYVPAKPILFNINSSEGKLTKVFKSTDSVTSLKNLWMLSVPGSVGLGYYLHELVSVGALYVYLPHLIVAPFLIRFINQAFVSLPATRVANEIYLMRNGDQILLKTIDGIWHKINIQEIQKYNMKDKGRIMYIDIITNNRKYSLSTKNKEFVNFEILDKVLKGVCIKTGITKARARPPPNLSNESVVAINIVPKVRLS